MSKTIWLASVTILTVFAAAFSLKTSVSETAAGTRHASITISVADLQQKANMKSMPVMKMDDMSFVFTDTESTGGRR